MLLGNEQMNEGGILILFYHKVMFILSEGKEKTTEETLFVEDENFISSKYQYYNISSPKFN